MRFMYIIDQKIVGFYSCTPEGAIFKTKQICRSLDSIGTKIDTIDLVLGNLAYKFPKYGEFGLVLHMYDGKTKTVQVLPDPADHDKLLKEDLEKDPLSESNRDSVAHRCWAIECLGILWNEEVTNNGLNFQEVNSGEAFDYFESNAHQVSADIDKLDEQKMIPDLEKRGGIKGKCYLLQKATGFNINHSPDVKKIGVYGTYEEAKHMAENDIWDSLREDDHDRDYDPVLDEAYMDKRMKIAYRDKNSRSTTTADIRVIIKDDDGPWYYCAYYITELNI